MTLATAINIAEAPWSYTIAVVQVASNCLSTAGYTELAKRCDDSIRVKKAFAERENKTRKLKLGISRYFG